MTDARADRRADAARSAESGFGINTYSFIRSGTALECLSRLSDRGYATFEIMMYPGHLWSGGEGDNAANRALDRFLANRGLRIVSLNTPNVDINIVGAAEETRTFSLRVCARLIRLAAELGARGVVLGPGKANPLFPGPRGDLLDHFYRALDKLLPVADAAGVGIFIENLPFSYLPDAATLMAALREYGDDRVGICYDVANGHYIGEDPCAGLRRVRERLRLIHLSDTGRRDYRHDAVGVGGVPFARISSMLGDLGREDPPVLEIISENPLEAIDQSVRTLAALGW